MERVEEWWDWLEPRGNESHHHGNKSSDVMCANCVSHPDPVACMRSAVTAVCGVSTALIALCRIASLHHRPSPIRLLLYYLLLVHSLAGSLEWLLGWTTQLALFVAYAKAIEVLIVCYFYIDVASNMMHWNSRAGKRLCFSSLFLMFTYFTMFLVMGFLLSIEPWQDCHAPYWIWFSTGEFFIVQLMVGSFLLIVHRMNRISASPNIRRAQRVKLFSLFWVFETSAAADLGYHISLYLLAGEEGGCSAVFNHDQMRYSMLKLPYDVFSFLLPVWAILYVFGGRSKGALSDEDSTDSLHSSSHSQVASVTVVRNWRRRYRPLNQGSAYDPVDFVSAPQQLRRVRQQAAALSPSGSRVRRVSSAPSIPLPRRLSVSRSLISSPLYPIMEEMGPHLERAPPVYVHTSSFDNLSTTVVADEE